MQSFQKCEEDGDCLEGEYCYHKWGDSFCQLCESCENRFYRQPRNGVQCAKSWSECGGCLDSFEEIDHGDGDVSERCVEVEQEPILEILSAQVKNLTSITEANVIYVDATLCLVAILCAVVLLAILVYLVKKLYLNRHKGYKKTDSDEECGSTLKS